MQDKPFALLGVNVGRHDPQSLKKVMEEEHINWRTFADQGTIIDKWNKPPTPTFYILDHQGRIRHKWIGHPGEKAIDSALEQLIKVAEEAKMPK